MDRKRHGLHYTPPALAAFVADRALAAAPDRPLRVLDPACGDGELLAAVAALAPGASLTGYDLDERAVATAQARLPTAAIAHKDFLESPPPERFDLVVTNPRTCGRSSSGTARPSWRSGSACAGGSTWRTRSSASRRGCSTRAGCWRCCAPTGS
ncbi:class I SAM-dependent methyltransferase [Actinokineospora soli]|uniref:Class I SAM-dependent methyltransferase n=1 Tax=Actinokineospora soli TaxID=1048753 RepID=A0ABW2TYP0_9PSEU